MVRENTAARGFYKTLGEVEKNSFTDAGPLRESDLLIVAWDNLEIYK